MVIAFLVFDTISVECLISLMSGDVQKMVEKINYLYEECLIDLRDPMYL